MYLRSFGIRFELPTAHIIDAAVFARNPRYVIQVGQKLKVPGCG